MFWYFPFCKKHRQLCFYLAVLRCNLHPQRILQLRLFLESTPSWVYQGSLPAEARKGDQKWKQRKPALANNISIQYSGDCNAAFVFRRNSTRRAVILSAPTDHCIWIEFTNRIVWTMKRLVLGCDWRLSGLVWRPGCQLVSARFYSNRNLPNHPSNFLL